MAATAYEVVEQTTEHDAFHALWKKEANIVWKDLFQLGNVCNLLWFVIAMTVLTFKTRSIYRPVSHSDCGIYFQWDGGAATNKGLIL